MASDHALPPALPPTAWHFPDPALAEGDVVGVGGDLAPGTILHAYTRGIFPMPLEGRLAWWSPDPRAVLPLEGFRLTKSLRRSSRRFEVRVDTAFDRVVEACADPRRPHGWITREIAEAYGRLHRLGWAHSVEAWSLDDGTLAGGLYGVAIGRLFAGESMFHRRTDASKVALAGLVEILGADGAPGGVLDLQWLTPHLASLGAVELERRTYLDIVANAVRLPPPSAFGAILGNRP